MYSYMKPKVELAQKEASIAQEANKENIKTLAIRDKELKRAVTTCANRIVAKDKLIKDYMRIIKLKGVSNEADNISSGSDILSELNGLYKTSGEDEVRLPGDTPTSATD